MKYVIVSQRLGTPGAEYLPEEGVNVEALLEGGFIQLSGGKSAKLEPTTEQEQSWQPQQFSATPL